MGDPLPHQHVAFVFAIVVAGLGAWFDLRRGEIPNWLTYGALLLGPILNVGRMLYAKEAMDAALTEGGLSIGGMMMCALVPAILYRQGGIAGGDLKLLAAMGGILQTTLGVEAEMYCFFGAALIAPAILAYRGTLLSTIKNSFAILANLFLPKAKRRTVEASALTSLKLGPAVLFGVTLTAYLHW